MRFRKPTAAALIPAMLFTGVPSLSFAQDAPTPTPPAATAPAEDVAPPAEDRPVKGQLLELDGTTPLADTEIRIIETSQGRVVDSTRTAADGTFALRQFVVGGYLLETVGVSQFVNVTPDSPIKSLKILSPGPRKPRALVGGAVPVQSSTLPSVLFWVGAGAGVILAGVGGYVWGYQQSGPFHRDYASSQFISTNPVLFELNPDGNFGQVPINLSRTREFVLRNVSPVTLTGTLEIDGVDADQFDLLGSSSFSLGPESTRTVTVVFSPDVLGSKTATLRATLTNAQPGQQANVTRSLTGECVAPGVVSPFIP